MPRRLVVTAEASKLYSRKARWSAYKRQMCKWLIDTLQLELHAYEIAGQLEGQCVFVSSYHGAQITGWVCTFDDKISVCVTSIRFDDGDGWRPGGGPRKPNFANLEIISGSSIRGGGRCWEIEQEYGDDVIGAPGPLNGKLREPMQWSAVRGIDVRTAAVRNDDPACEETSQREKSAADVAERSASIREVLDLLLAQIDRSIVLCGNYILRNRREELDGPIEKIGLCKALLSKWFDASRGYGSIARSSTMPAMASMSAGKPSSRRVFISYRRADPEIGKNGSGSAQLRLLERVLLAEIVQRVNDVERVWIEAAGSHCDRPEALHLLSVLATVVSELLARDTGRPGHENPIDESGSNLLDSVAAAAGVAVIGDTTRGPPLH